MKIAVNSRMFLEKGTGVPNYVSGLYRACLKMDSRNRYIFFQPNSSRTLGETLTANVPNGLIGAAWFDLFRTQKLIRENAPQIFHSPSHILPLRKLRGVKYAVTVHDLAYRILPEQYGWKHKSYYGWQVPRALQMADAIIAVSHNTKRDIVEHYKIAPERIEVVHHGVAEQFLAAENLLPRIIAEKYFFSVTTHPRRKNILGALKAFAIFAAQSDVKYVVAGLMSEPEQQEFLALAEKLGVRWKVELFGYASSEQLISLYQNAEFTIYPSFYEGFGFPALEAMACGSPVITSNTSSLPEIMPDADWLVNPHSVEEIAMKMQKLLALTSDERKKICEKNRQHARQFTWQKSARRTIDIFEKLIG